MHRVTIRWTPTICQECFMDKSQILSLEETRTYLTPFTYLHFLARRAWCIKNLLYKLCKISWNFQGLPVSHEKVVKEQVHELWEKNNLVLRNYTTTLATITTTTTTTTNDNSNNISSSSHNDLDQCLVICFLTSSFLRMGFYSLTDTKLAAFLRQP